MAHLVVPVDWNEMMNEREVWIGGDRFVSGYLGPQIADHVSRSVLLDDGEYWLVVATMEWRSDLGGWVAIVQDPQTGGMGWTPRQGDERCIR